MNTTPYTDDVRLAHTLADSVDRVAMARFTDHSMSVHMKDDGTPVTDADREIEQLIRAQLQRARIRDGVAGEESGTRVPPHGSGLSTRLMAPATLCVVFRCGLPLLLFWMRASRWLV